MGHYEVDARKFAIDQLDGETMLMDLERGRLVLLEEGSSAVWPLISRGASVSSLREHILGSHGSLAAEAFSALVDRLIHLGALVPAQASSATEPLTLGEVPANLDNFPISEYDDISNIITMDPIHDVDPERGWPFDKAQ